MPLTQCIECGRTIKHYDGGVLRQVRSNRRYCCPAHRQRAYRRRQRERREVVNRRGE